MRAAIERCEAIREEVSGDLVATADILQPLAGLHAMEGRFDEARALIAAADAAFEELGRTLGSAVSHHAAIVELLAGDPVAAERLLRQGYAALEEMGEKPVLSTTAAFLGQALLAQGRHEEAGRVGGAAATSRRAEDDMHSQACARGCTPRCCPRAASSADAERSRVRRSRWPSGRTTRTRGGGPRRARRRARAARAPRGRAGGALARGRAERAKGNLVGRSGTRQLAPLARV